MEKKLKLDGISKLKAAAQETETPNVQKVVPVESVEDKKRGRPATMKGNKEIRATFIVREDYVERLKDYVFQQKLKNKRAGYTLKDALNDALETFFQKVGHIEERPEGFRDKAF